MLAELFADLSGPWRDACFLLEKSGKIVAANAAGARILGLLPSEVAGKNLGDFVEETSEAVAAYLALCARNRQQMPGALSGPGPDGGKIKYSCQGYRLRAKVADQPLVFLRCCGLKSASSSFIALNQQLERQIARHQKLAASHSILKTLLDSLEALVYVADMETHELLFVNRYGREKLGDIIGSLCWQSLQKGQTGPCPFCTNHLLLNQDGRPAGVHTWEFFNPGLNRWFHIHDRAIPWTDGRLVRLEIATDITLIKEAEEKTRRDEELASALFALSRKPFVSREALSGFALEEAARLTGSPVAYLHFMNADQRSIELFSWSAAVRKHCTATKTSHYPLEQAGIWADCVRLRRPVIHNDFPAAPGRKGYPEGHFPVLRHMSVPIFSEERIVAIIGVGNKEQPYQQDDAELLYRYMNNFWAILKQKEAELEARSVKDQWEKTFDAIEDVVCIHDHDMRIVRANKAAGALFGLVPAELVGRYCYEVFRGATEPCAGCPEVLARDTLSNQRASVCHENLGKTFSAASFPIVDQDGLYGFVHIARDISEQVKMEERLRQSQKMEAIGTLAGGIAHDFNNILAPILGYTELALTRINPGEDLAGDLHQVVKAAIRAKELVQQILSFSRQSPKEERPLQPHLVIKEALKLLRASLPATIEIREDICPDCGSIMADPTQLHQIIMNLCTNAYHAMREKGGVLAVSLREVTIGPEDNKVTSFELEPGNYVLLQVSDTGCGMDQATLVRIFEPYFTTKDIGEGTGLGLSVVHGIVKSHHGQITAYSEPGRGTNFHVYLPAIVREPDLEISAVSGERIATGRERILVADDEEQIREMLRLILEGLGYKVTTAVDGLAALAFVQQDVKAYDLLITDMTMPGLTGFELIMKVKEIDPDLPVILCTGFSELINKEQARAIGIKAYLMKPVSVRELARAVRTALDGK